MTAEEVEALTEAEECYKAKSASGRMCTLRLGGHALEVVDTESGETLMLWPLEAVRSYGQTNRR